MLWESHNGEVNLITLYKNTDHLEVALLFLFKKVIWIQTYKTLFSRIEQSIEQEVLWIL